MIGVNQHNLFGCFFTSPTAAAPTKAEYDICASFPPPPIEVGPYSEILLESEARASQVCSTTCRCLCAKP
jgi:hypothetical protein